MKLQKLHRSDSGPSIVWDTFEDRKAREYARKNFDQYREWCDDPDAKFLIAEGTYKSELHYVESEIHRLVSSFPDWYEHVIGRPAPDWMKERAQKEVA